MAVLSSINPKVQPIGQIVMQKIVIQRQRRGDISATGKSHQTNSIIGPVVNKFGQDLLGQKRCG